MRSSTGSKRKSRTRERVGGRKGMLTLLLSGLQGGRLRKWYLSPSHINGDIEACLRTRQLTDALLCFGELRISLTVVGGGSPSLWVKRSNSSRKTRRAKRTSRAPSSPPSSDHYRKDPFAVRSSSPHSRAYVEANLPNYVRSTSKET